MLLADLFYFTGVALFGLALGFVAFVIWDLHVQDRAAAERAAHRVNLGLSVCRECDAIAEPDDIRCEMCCEPLGDFEPTDDQMANRFGVEGGIAYGPAA